MRKVKDFVYRLEQTMDVKFESYSSAIASKLIL